MVWSRLLLFALSGALGATLLSFVIQFLLLRGAGVDPMALAPGSLVTEVMELHRHGLLGALVGVVLGPFPPKIDQRLWAMVRWLIAGVVLTLLWPLIPVFTAAGGLPTAAEVAAGYQFKAGIIPAGLGAGLSCALVELALLWGRARRQRGARRYQMGGENQVDETLREFWHDRADAYLAGKSREDNRRDLR